MKAYQVRYDEFRLQHSEVIAVSIDDAKVQAKFKARIGAQFRFVGDPEGRLIDLYGLRGFMFSGAKRKTLVLDKDRRIKKVISGPFAAMPQAALNTACSLVD
jgi:peroxiredoxin